MPAVDPVAGAPLATSLDLEPPSSAIVVTAVTPSEIEDDGGYSLRLTGTFRPTDPAVVQLVDQFGGVYLCYAAKSGQGNTPYPRNTTTMIVATPGINPGVYSVRVTQGADVGTLNSGLTVLGRQWKSKAMQLRRVFPPHYAMGIRDIARAPLLTTDLEIGQLPALAGVSTVPFTHQLLSNNPLGFVRTWTSIGAALPGWMSLNASTGLLTGTPGPGDVGTYAGLRFRVNDTVQNSDSNIVGVTVTA